VLAWALLGWFAGGAQAQAAEPETLRFPIDEFVVEGDTLLGAGAIERAIYGYTGPNRTVADAEAARKALQQAYQEAGFLSVTVVLPPQRVDSAGGEVRLQVLQAPVERLRVTGAQYHRPSLVKQSVPSVAPGTVPNFNEMQQELAQVQAASADREITPILAAGRQPGTLDVELKVKDQLPLHGWVELNNKQTLDTRAGRLEAGISYDNLFQRQHALSFNWLVSPRADREVDIQTLGYALPLGGEGDRLTFRLTHSNNNTPTLVGGESVSRGQTLRARWRDALPPRPGLAHGLTWGLTLSDLRDRSVSATGLGSEAPSLRYGVFSAAYDISLADNDSGRSTSLQAELKAGLPGLNRRSVDCGGVQRDQFACKRADASPGFQVLGLTLSHREPLGRWQVSALLQAQVTDAPLVSAEQAVYGGVDSVRGYYEGEQAGDLGAALRLQVLTPTWAPLRSLTVQALAFGDVARLMRLYASAVERSQADLASGGLGLRLSTSFGLQAELTGSQVLRESFRLGPDGRQQPVTGQSTGRHRRWDLSLRQSF
jgi:hemolysin activation/secretion protein